MHFHQIIFLKRHYGASSILSIHFRHEVILIEETKKVYLAQKLKTCNFTIDPFLANLVGLYLFESISTIFTYENYI